MKVAIGLGASIGSRRARLERTVLALAAHPRLTLLQCSRWYRSPPMRGGTAVGWFLNGVALFDTDLSPYEVLALCRTMENAAGRRRARYWGDRPLDLDVLAVEDWSSDDPELTVPHPGVGSRPFVYWPLREVWPACTEALTTSPPSSSGIVAVGVLARGGPPSYTACHRIHGADHEALHRQCQPRPHPRDPRLGRAGGRHHESLPDRQGRR